MKTKLFSFLLFSVIAIHSSAQCSHDPTISGTLILCDNDSSVISTQTYDSYQWYKREWGTGNPFVAIAGATQQTLTVYEQTDILYEFVVEATLAGCTEASDTVLIDGYVFLLPYAIHDYLPGTVEYNSTNDVFEVCNGYTTTLEGNDPPYTTYTWYHNGSVIAGATTNIYTVTADGSYTFDACTGVCPNFCQPLGVTLNFDFGDWAFCPANGINKIESQQLTIAPNPAQNLVRLKFPYTENSVANFTDVTGRIVKSITLASPDKAIDISDLLPGIYFVNVELKDAIYTARFIKD